MVGNTLINTEGSALDGRRNKEPCSCAAMTDLVETEVVSGRCVYSVYAINVSVCVRKRDFVRSELACYIVGGCV